MVNCLRGTLSALNNLHGPEPPGGDVAAEGEPVAKMARMMTVGFGGRSFAHAVLPAFPALMTPPPSLSLSLSLSLLFLPSPFSSVVRLTTLVAVLSAAEKYAELLAGSSLGSTVTAVPLVDEEEDIVPVLNMRTHQLGSYLGRSFGHV